jgi:class 3 adenylate cyclase
MPEDPNKPTSPSKPTAAPESNTQKSPVSPPEAPKPNPPSYNLEKIRKLLGVSEETRAPRTHTFRINASDLLMARAKADHSSGVIDLLRPAPSARVQQLEAEIAVHRAELRKQTAALETEQKSRQELEAKVREYQQTQAKLKAAEEIAFILSRIHPDFHDSLGQRKDVQAKFFAKEEQPAYVLAIDIRRSTDLMLKARRPDLFAHFMTELCDELHNAITGHFGVFDKFTGDGILAFFPDFFTGPDAAYHAVAAAHEASGIFTRCYQKHRASFTSILTDVNLATGIDYGGVHLVRVADGLTVVGVPVVYACRLSSGGAGGEVLLNQAAYEKLSAQYSKFFYINEQQLDIKHEGSILCYKVKPGNSKMDPRDPEWMSEISAQEEEPKPAPSKAQPISNGKPTETPKQSG